MQEPAKHDPLATPGVIAGQPQRSERSVIAYLAFLGVMLATGIDIALPAFTEIDDAFPGENEVALVVTLYVLGMAGGQLIWGPIADRFGRVPALQAGIALYIMGAIGSALAPSFGTLLAARAMWGLGAAAPAGLRNAIARDLYSGDRMARVITIMMAVFLLGPVFVPLLGELLLNVAPWPVVFWAAAAIAVIGSIWCLRFGETLDPANVRPIQFSPLLDAIKLIIRTRVTIGHILAATFYSAAFFIFLGSSQPIFDDVFGRKDQFALLFALLGVITIPLLLVNDRAIERFSARRMAVVVGGAVVVAAVLGLIFVSGRPSFWVWYAWLATTTALSTVANPPMSALALEPMGELAGTASSLMYFMSFAGGAGLAAIFSVMIEDTVTPFAAGYAMYTAIGFAMLLWAGSYQAAG